MAKPFRCNTYKKQGEGSVMVNQPFGKKAPLDELPCFHAIAHSFPRRQPRGPFLFSDFRTPFVATEGVGWSSAINVQLSTVNHLGVTTHSPCYTVPPMARQRLGQHFLADLHWREEIARAIRVSPHSTAPLPRDEQHCWIEIGAGHGEITQHLLATGTPVHAIEIDPAFIPPPEVTSALVTLRLPGERGKLQLGSRMGSNKDAQANPSRDAESCFLDFVKLCFSKKRKTLVNNLRTLAKPDRV